MFRKILALFSLFSGLAACIDLGDQPMDWSKLDRPGLRDAGTVAPPDAGGTSDRDARVVPDDRPLSHAEVLLRRIAIEPMTTRIAAGGTVTWFNLDVAPHDVRSGAPEAPSPLFNSGLLSVGETFTFEFDTPGRVTYYCSTHSHEMRDAVVEVVGVEP